MYITQNSWKYNVQKYANYYFWLQIKFTSVSVLHRVHKTVQDYNYSFKI